MTEATETNRDRVRRILFRPLDLRFPVRGPDAKTPDEGRALLNQIADELARLSDLQLAAMINPVRRAAEGKPYWPSRGAFLSVAEWIAPSPLDLDPALLSWFASVEGPKAIAAGTLVETWLFVSDKKRPPFSDRDQAKLRSDARENAARLERLADRRRCGLPMRAQDQDELKWERWYLDRRAKCEAAIKALRAEKGAA